MAIFSLVQTIWAAGLPSFSQLAQLGLSSSPLARGAGSQMVLHDPVTGRVDSFGLGSGSPINSRDISTGPQGTMRSISFEGTTREIDQATLTRLANGASSGGASAVTWLDGNGFYGNQVRLEMLDLGSQKLLAVSRPGGAGFSTYLYTDSGPLTVLQGFVDSAKSNIAAVSAMTGAHVGGQNYLITASMSENTLTLYRIKPDGKLALKSTIGFADQLPVNQPSVLKTIDRGDTALLVMGSYGSSSLTVMQLDADGSLRFVDQANDSRDTRFAKISAMDVIRVEGHDLVAVGGNDGGVTLYQILPNGRLLHRETLIDTMATALDGISGLQFTQTGAGLELWVVATRDKGLTRLRLDADSLGLRPMGVDGGAGSDVLVASPAGGTLRGHGGDDILIDGAGVDVLVGGAGADMFVFMPDGRTDTIQDFDPRADKLDLSAYPLVQGIGDITVRPIAGGAIVRVGNEDLYIYTANGAGLTATQLAPALIFGAGHVFMPEPISQKGTSDNDLFKSSGTHPDTIDGGDGVDMISFLSNSTKAVIVDLRDSSKNGGDAAGYVLSSIEGVTGTKFNDRITGDDGHNQLIGMGGNDQIWGMGGNDWITPGTGSDTIDGGDGVDMVSFIDHAQGIIVDMSAGTVRSGRDTNIILNVENITGSTHGDHIQGGAGDNLLRGVGGYDWFIGSGGNDTYDGGNGRDMVSYIYANGPVTVDLGQKKGLAGQALGDTYISIERVTGSIYPDIFYGTDGEDEFRGMGGEDLFYDSPGRDRYDGGASNDTVSYALSPHGVTASLLRGSGGPDRDLYTSIENLIGSSRNDMLTGDHGRNALRGGRGDDTLMGLGGNDVLEGGLGDDVLIGGPGYDVAFYRNPSSEYTISTVGKVTTVSHPIDGIDTLTEIETMRFGDGYIML